MDEHELQRLRAIINDLAGWVGRARAVQAQRARIEQAAADATRGLLAAVIELRRGETVEWRVLPRLDARLLGEVAAAAQLPLLTDEDRVVLEWLGRDVLKALHEVKAITGARRFFSGSAGRASGQQAAEFLAVAHAWGSSNIPQLLHRLEQHPSQVPVGPRDALADAVGLRDILADLGDSPEVLWGPLLTELPGAVRVIGGMASQEPRLRSDAQNAGNAVRGREVRRLVSEMPVERLKDATRDRLRVGPLSDAGITTVQAVLDRGAQLEYLPGIGPTTATRMRGAAQTLWTTTFDEMPVRIDIAQRNGETTELLRSLRAWDAVRRTQAATGDRARAAALAPLAAAMDATAPHVVVIPGTSSAADFRDAVEAVVNRGRMIRDSASESSASGGPWDDFMSRPADYFAMLAELGFFIEDEQKTHGDLPDDIVEAVRALELNTEHLTASLRGYQSFGARFALVQRKVIIGDEMGLGKTVEALAVLAHLRAKGSHRSVVVCPAAVVTNWVREVHAKSTLRPHRVHGPGRDTAAKAWLRSGGVAVTTYETLAWFERHLINVSDLGCVIVDEAHYIKNPAAQRSMRTARLLRSCERAVLLTGTPLENRIEEFANLVGYIRPDILVDAEGLAPRRFRQQVAPAYLRRNQEDVLTELPELVEVDEWLGMSSQDEAAYRTAVADGNFMAMRQAAMRAGQQSEKVQRLMELVEEAEDNGRRVIVFSHFRDALNQVARALPGRVFGPLTGSVPAAARQDMVDRFSAAGHGAVLVAQIVAGGVGLNIQVASVVVICEPQLKPTTEWQAIARARRMGQLNTVQVHRLLSEDGVDQRITEILARKRGVFDAYARISETAESAPEALDISEAALAREVVAAERERLFSAKVTEPAEEVQV